jgi:DNA repair protein RecO (recombination protein O)
VSSAARRIRLEPAYLLHHYAYRDSSRILELLTRGYGRVSLCARAARRGGSGLPSLLQSFVPLLVSWTMRTEAGHLNGAERAEGVISPVPPERLMSGFYANELLVRLLPRNDPHPRIYDAYERLVRELADSSGNAVRALRMFEIRLLEEVGYGVDLGVDTAGNPIDPTRAYRHRPGVGVERVDGVAEGTLIFSGASLLGLARGDLDEARVLADAKRLTRAALDACLEGRGLRTREVMLAMQAHRDALDGG